MNDRSFRSFLRATWQRPGSWARLVAVFALGTASVIKGGFLVAFLILAGVFVVGSAIAYPYYRRHGRLLVDKWGGW